MSTPARLDRRTVVKALLQGRNDAVVVSGLGAATFDVAAAGDHDRNFYLWGAMGGTVALGLGLALARPETPVVVVTGDGDMLMGMGSFATVAPQRPGNLAIVVLDNSEYGETGGQATHTASGADLARIAAGCGITDATVITQLRDVEALARRIHTLKDGPLVTVIKIEGGEAEKVLPARDGVFLKNRLRNQFGLEAQ